MIYTVTFNPALDYVMRVREFTPFAVNRTYEEFLTAGGKGINVSVVLRRLGQETTALGFTAGFTGDEIIRQVQAEGVTEQFIRLPKGTSRVNVKLKNDNAGETEINAQGPHITDEALQALRDQADKLVDGDWLVLSGSIPNGIPNTVYRELAQQVGPKGVRIVVDAEQTLLSNVLDQKPFLIKPNHHELAQLFNTPMNTIEDVIGAARKLREQGARNVLVSMAGDGALLLTETDECYRANAPKGKLVNSVGAGDSMVAGFIAGFIEGQGDYTKALQTGIAAGSASAFHEDLATGTQIRSLLPSVIVTAKE